MSVGEFSPIGVNASEILEQTESLPRSSINGRARFNGERNPGVRTSGAKRNAVARQIPAYCEIQVRSAVRF
jgi:hypothetical protein